MTKGGKSALIFGASGVTGWSFVNEILSDYPKKGVWNKVHALTNRPLSQKDSFWPDDPRLNIVSGIDLTAGSQEDLENLLKSKVEDIEQVTHVYYLAYAVNAADLDKEFKDAVSMFERSTTALDHLSPALEFVVMQTGAKWYACHFLALDPTYGGTPGMEVPYKESAPRIKEPWGSSLFYHNQFDWITEYAKDKRWNWCDTRPDIIIGFVPNQNFYSLGTNLAVFLSLFRAVNGEGADCPFPGAPDAFKAKGTLSSSVMIAHQTLHLSLTLSTDRKGESFNVADAKTPTCWESDWPTLCAYFGLKGLPPPLENPVEPRAYIKSNFARWEELEREHSLKTGMADSPRNVPNEYFLLTLFNFDRQYDMSKMYATGFEEERTCERAWYPVFDKFRAAKIIPTF